jgi:hypothetical protein
MRSSAAEYLTFVAASGTSGVEAVYSDEDVWLSQRMMAQLYDVEVPTINYHLKKVFEDSELEEDAVIRNFRITAADGKTYDTKHYNLSAIAARVRAPSFDRAPRSRERADRQARAGRPQARLPSSPSRSSSRIAQPLSHCPHHPGQMVTVGRILPSGQPHALLPPAAVHINPVATEAVEVTVVQSAEHVVAPVITALAS